MVRLVPGPSEPQRSDACSCAGTPPRSTAEVSRLGRDWARRGRTGSKGSKRVPDRFSFFFLARFFFFPLKLSKKKGGHRGRPCSLSLQIKAIVWNPNMKHEHEGTIPLSHGRRPFPYPLGVFLASAGNRKVA